MIAKSASRRQKVVDVFCVSKFAPRGGCPKSDVDCITKLRKEEELANCIATGAEVDFLRYQDAPMRGYKRVLKDSPNFFLERDLIIEIKENIRNILRGSERVFFPLAVGRHVDHIIVNKIGLELAVEERNLRNTYFYEDLPYMAWNPIRYSTMDLSSGDPDLESSLLSFPWRKKWGLCKSYRSQFSRKEYRGILRYAKGIRLFGLFYERVWRVRSEGEALNLLEKISQLGAKEETSQPSMPQRNP